MHCSVAFINQYFSHLASAVWYPSIGKSKLVLILSILFLKWISSRFDILNIDFSLYNCFQVVASTSDKGSANVRFYNMHGNPGQICYKSLNLFAPTRYIYFFSDVPHLLKTIRNNVAKSGYGTNTKYLWVKKKKVLQTSRHSHYCTIQYWLNYWLTWAVDCWLIFYIWDAHYQFILYFELVAFFHVKLWSDVCPRVDNQASGNTFQDYTLTIPLMEKSPSTR